MDFKKVRKTSGYINSSENLPIYYDLYEPRKKCAHKLPVVLFLHGFKGFKDWGPFPEACQFISAKGYIVVAFNFSRNGVGKSKTEFDELHLFADQTLSQDLKDVGAVLQAVLQDEIKPEKNSMDKQRPSIIGHSRGGHTAVAAAAEYDELRCLITWSAVANYNERWSDDMLKDWKNNGYTEIENARTGQVMRVNKSVYDDAIKNEDQLMASKRIAEVDIPTLIIHSEKDEAVPREDADRLFKAAKTEKKNCIIIPGTGHTFGGAHPFNENDFPPPFKNVLEYSVQWLDAYL